MTAKTLLLIYNLALCLIFTLTGTIFAKSSPQLVNSLIFLPLVFYFSLALFRHLRANAAVKKTAQVAKPTSAALAKKADQSLTPNPEEPALEGEAVKDVPEVDRRIFLKLIGSAGISLFMLALFTKKAQAAFFGSVPGPGTIALKDTAGVKIDPAKHHPTAGFKISQIDDTSSATYAYYGFLDKTGAWYLQREQLTGADAGQYLYSTGSSGFSTAWINRVSPTPAYATFDSTF